MRNAYKYILPVGVVVLLFAVYKHFFPSKEEIDKGVNDFLGTSAFNLLMPYKQDPPFISPLILSNADIINIADSINNAFGNFNDDEAQVYTQLRRIRSFSDSCRVAIYSVDSGNKCPKDLITEYMSNEEIYKVWQIVKNYN